MSVGKVLSSNQSNSSMTLRVHSIENDFFISSTTAERLQSNNNSKSVNVLSVTEDGNNYDRFVKTGVNGNVFANVIVRTGRQLMTPEGRQRFQGRSPMPITTCPVCDGKIRRHLLVRHLIVEHGIPVDKAGAMAGLQFSDERKDMGT